MAINFLQSTDFSDDAKLQFGNSTDFEIYHDSSTNQNKITSLLGRQLLINTASFVVNNAADTQNMIIATDGGAVSLYCAGNLKLATTSVGSTITGGLTTTASSSLAGANMSAGIAMGTNAITGMADPSSAQDAATKSYVDTQISGVPQGTVQSVATGSGLTGGTITSTGTLSVDYSSSGLVADCPGGTGSIDENDFIMVGKDSSGSGETRTYEIRVINALATLGTMSSWLLTGDSGGSATIDNGETVDIAGGTNITTVRSGNTVTINTSATTNIGTVTSIATTSPITGGTITGSGTIALDQSAITSLANLVETGTVTSGVWNSNTQLNKTSSTFLDYQGEVVYWASSTVVKGKIYVYQGGDWVSADADAASTASGTLAVALNNGTSSTVGMLTRGTVTLTDLGNDGDLLYLDTNAGNLTTEPPSGSGDIVRIVGQLLDSTNGQIFFNPDYTFITLS